MADDEFNLDDPGTEGGSEASLDDFFQPTGGGKADSGGGSPVDDFFAPPTDAPPPRAAKPVSDLPIDKSRLGDFPEEPEELDEPALTPLEAEPMADEGEEPAAPRKKFDLGKNLKFVFIALAMILAGGVGFVAYQKFFAAKPEVVVAPVVKPKKTGRVKPAPAPAPKPAAPATAEGKTVEQPADDVKPATVKPATIESEDELIPPAGDAMPGKTAKPGKPTAEVEPEPETESPPAVPPKTGKGKPGKEAAALAPLAPPPAPSAPSAKPGKPGKTTAAAPAPLAPPPAPVTAKPGKPGKAPAAIPSPPPKAPAVATSKPGKAPAPPKAPVRPAAPAPAARPSTVARTPRAAAVASSGPWFVQVGSYMLESSKDQPEQLLGDLGFSAYHYTPEHRRMRIHHVLVGRNLDANTARQITSQLQGLGYVPEAGPNGSVKVYSYGSAAIARATRAKLVRAGFKNVTIKEETKSVTLDQLRVGGFSSRSQAAKAQQQLRRGGFRGCVVVKEY